MPSSCPLPWCSDLFPLTLARGLSSHVILKPRETLTTSTADRHALPKVIMTTWWSDAKISATVDETFVTKEIGSKKNQDALKRPLAFGDGLTDDSYLDWILQRGRRFFLILNAIGVPDAIFSIVDQSFVDDDLPLAQNDLWEQNLFGSKSETMDKRFYREQFKYLVKDLEPGGHVEYGPDDVVPLEPIAKRTPVTNASASSDRVLVEKKSYLRKKVHTSGDNGVDRVQFTLHLHALLTIKHAHIVKIWATYSQEEFSYMLITPTTDLTLKAFLEDQPKAFKQLEKAERRETLLTWIHCLSSALAYLHSKGFIHSTLRPSSILIDDRNTICISEYSALKLLDGDDNPKAYKAEIYEHSAPEIWSRRPSLHDLPALKTVLPGGGRSARRLPAKDPVRRPPSRHDTSDGTARPRSETTSSSSSSASKPRNAIITTFRPPGGENDASCPSDVFSLSTLLILILSFALSHSPKAFAAHRCRHNRQAGRGGAPPDASFHVNLGQVFTWMDTLQQEAKLKSKKDKKSDGINLWSAVSGMVKTCRKTLRKDPKERLTARELEQETRRYLDKGLGVAARWCCGGEEEELAPGLVLESVDGSELETEQKRGLAEGADPRSVAKTKAATGAKDHHSQGDGPERREIARSASSSSSPSLEPSKSGSTEGKSIKKFAKVPPKPKPPLSLVAARIAREKEDLAKSKQVLVQEQHDLVKEKRDLAKLKKTIAYKEREIQKQEEAIFLRPEDGRGSGPAAIPMSPSRRSMSLNAPDGRYATTHDHGSTTSRSLSVVSLDAPTTTNSHALHHSVLTGCTSPPPRIPEEEDSLSDEAKSQRTQLLPPSDDEWPLNNSYGGHPVPLSGSGSPDTATGSPTLERTQSRPFKPPRFHQSNSADTLDSHTQEQPHYLSSSADAMKTRPLPKVPSLQQRSNRPREGKTNAGSVHMPPPVIPSDPFEKLRKRVERAAQEDRLRTLEALEGGPRSPVPPATYGDESHRGGGQAGYDMADAKLREVYEDRVDVGQGEVEWLAL